LRDCLFSFDVFEMDPVSRTQTVAGLLDPPRIIFAPIIEPILLRFETDQNPGRLAVTRNDDLLRLGLAKNTGTNRP